MGQCYGVFTAAALNWNSAAVNTPLEIGLVVAAPYRPFVSKVSVISNVQTPIAADRPMH